MNLPPLVQRVPENDLVDPKSMKVGDKFVLHKKVWTILQVNENGVECSAILRFSSIPRNERDRLNSPMNLVESRGAVHYDAALASRERLPPNPVAMTRNVYILGIDHEIQTLDGKRAGNEKAEFESLLRALVPEAEFIGEETLPEKETVAKSVTSSLGIRWEPIEMSAAAREALGIADEQLRERHEPIIQGGIPVGSRVVRVLSDGIREEYMLWRTLTKADEASNILVLCGFSHVDELRQKFEKAGHQVTTDSLCTRKWYTHPDCD